MLFTLCGQAQQKASKQNQKKSSLLLKKGLEKAEEGNFDAAVSFFNQSIELNPLNESSLLSLADLMYQMKSYDSTIGLIQKIILLNPSQEKPLIIPLLTSFLGIEILPGRSQLSMLPD